MKIEEAAELLDVEISVLSAYEATDPYNDNLVEGYICRQSDHRYGALLIYKVNDVTTKPQIVYATPKLHYPFGRTDDGEDEVRTYHFPKKVARLLVFTKYDGTNVNAYSYADANGECYVTYKTRLTPFLGESKFGNFRKLWDELLADEELRTLTDLVRNGGYTFSFEMYGYRNPHLLIYKESLATKLLFIVDQKAAAIFPPTVVPSAYSLEPEERLNRPEDLISFYNEARARVDTQNTKVVDGDEERIDGVEGYVFYLQDEDGVWSLWKCKGASIEALHWTSDVIPLSVILPTTWNALESCNELTVEYIKKLLQEEFKQHQIDASHTRIEKVVAQVISRTAWRTRVQEAYDALDVTFEDGKGSVMRALSQQFERNEMKGVFTALKELGLTA